MQPKRLPGRQLRQQPCDKTGATGATDTTGATESDGAARAAAAAEAAEAAVQLILQHRVAAGHIARVPAKLIAAQNIYFLYINFFCLALGIPSRSAERGVY